MKRILLRVSALAATAVAVAVGLYLGATLLGIFSGEYGFHPGADARTWSLTALSYGTSTSCVRCHALEAQALYSARHADIGCQSCHGPLAAHEAASEPDTTSVPVAVPTSALCVRCHTTAEGRPALAQITPADHYTDDCLGCHNPHSGMSNKPPIVSHPLDRLPPCIVCHGPDGFRARTARHPTEPTADNICLSCHAIDRGKVDVTVR